MDAREPDAEPSPTRAEDQARPSYWTAEPPDLAATGQRHGRGTSWVRRVLIVAGLGAAVLFVGYVGLTFLGAQVGAALRGTVEFGTGGSGCSIQGRASTFPPGGSLFVAAYPSRTVPAGEVLTLRVLRDGAELFSQPQTFDAALEPGDCVSGGMQGAELTPAHYRFEYLAGTETLAAGEFDVAP